MQKPLFRALVALVVLFSATNLMATEPHLQNIRQLTFGGDNAEAYFSPDGTKLAFQSNFKGWGHSCDQIHALTIADAKDSSYRPPLISTGKGRTTCAYYMPDGKHILYASTHIAGEACPPEPPPRKDRKYLWQVLPSYDIFIANEQGTMTNRLTNRDGYDAEATVSPKGDKIVFTSDRSGDLELWRGILLARRQKARLPRVTSGVRQCNC
jgi:Tol biopolymer transport system component